MLCKFGAAVFDLLLETQLSQMQFAFLDLPSVCSCQEFFHQEAQHILWIWAIEADRIFGLSFTLLSFFPYSVMNIFLAL